MKAMAFKICKAGHNLSCVEITYVERKFYNIHARDKSVKLNRTFLSSYKIKFSVILFENYSTNVFNYIHIKEKKIKTL